MTNLEFEELTKTKNCGNCKFFVENPYPYSMKYQGNCIRFPPVVSSEPEPNSEFPLTKKTWVCGCYRKVKEVKIPKPVTVASTLSVKDYRDIKSNPTT